jgi:hypothetical protein
VFITVAALFLVGALALSQAKAPERKTVLEEGLA